MNTTYIAFLRGINIGGHNVKMERLRELFAELGLTNVRTYIQTGNVFFETDENDRTKLTQKIEMHLFETLGYEVPTFLRTIEEIEEIIDLDPFKNLKVSDDIRVCIVFTADPIPQNLSLPLHSAKGDMEIVAVTKYEAFVVWYIINGRPPSSQTLLNQNLGKKNTSRFWHTTIKILEAAKST